ncbi:MAG TPA: hypothetical protein VEG84_00800 [Thermoanaerobaculia bacterium]|nr:hypothetical protein [Thermoanaerobaculia bacterium]
MPEPTARRAALLVLGYVPLAGFLVLSAEKQDREIRWHARNGLLLFAAVAALGLCATLVGLLLPSFGCLYPVVMLAALVAYTLVTILAVVKAIQGERLIVPGISRFAR